MRRLLFSLALSGALAGCASTPPAQQSQTDLPAASPAPGIYLPDQHWLGANQHPDGRTQGYAFLLFGSAVDNNPQLAVSSCKALFTPDTDTSRAPAAATSIASLPTYALTSGGGDFTRASALLKWAWCNQLPQRLDRVREHQVLAELGLDAAQGPYLVAVPDAYSAAASAHWVQAPQVLVLQLSALGADQQTRALGTWKNLTHRSGAEAVSLPQLLTSMQSQLGQPQVVSIRNLNAAPALELALAEPIPDD